MPVRSLRLFELFAIAFLVATAGCAKKTPVAKLAPPPPPAAPTATLVASPDTVARGQSAKLTWNTSNANQVTITGIGSVGGAGSSFVIPQTSTTYVLTAKGPGGSQGASARVTVNVPPPSVAHAGPNDELLFSQNVRDVFFDYDKYAIRPDENSVVQQDAKFLAAHPNYKLMISGHCDERGSEDYNLALGDNRADSVRDQLERLGIRADRIHTISYGKEKPFCTDETAACWQLNRRAHFSMHP